MKRSNFLVAPVKTFLGFLTSAITIIVAVTAFVHDHLPLINKFELLWYEYTITFLILLVTYLCLVIYHQYQSNRSNADQEREIGYEEYEGFIWRVHIKSSAEQVKDSTSSEIANTIFIANTPYCGKCNTEMQVYAIQTTNSELAKAVNAAHGKPSSILRADCPTCHHQSDLQYELYDLCNRALKYIRSRFMKKLESNVERQKLISLLEK